MTCDDKTSNGNGDGNHPIAGDTIPPGRRIQLLDKLPSLNPDRPPGGQTTRYQTWWDGLDTDAKIAVWDARRRGEDVGPFTVTFIDAEQDVEEGENEPDCNCDCCEDGFCGPMEKTHDPVTQDPAELGVIMISGAMSVARFDAQSRFGAPCEVKDPYDALAEAEETEGAKMIAEAVEDMERRIREQEASAVASCYADALEHQAIEAEMTLGRLDVRTCMTGLRGIVHMGEVKQVISGDDLDVLIGAFKQLEDSVALYVFTARQALDKLGLKTSPLERIERDGLDQF